MAVITTIAIPEAWLNRLLPEFPTMRHDALWVKSAVRSLLINGITTSPDFSKQGREENAPKITVNLSLPEPEGGRAKQQAEQAGITIGQYCKAVLARLEVAEVSGNEEEIIPGSEWFCDLVKAMNKAGTPVNYRRDQAIHFTQLAHTLEHGFIGVCEAGTGTGKTLAILAAGIQIAEAKHQRVVIAVPTVAVMNQFADTYQTIQRSNDATPTLRPVLGRREFVSPSLIQVLLEEAASLPIDRTAVLDWIASGGQATGPIKMDWLTSSLLAVSPDFPVLEVILPDVIGIDDQGFLSYRSQFDDAREVGTEIVLCTHAMLARDMAARLGVANRDEAYQEQVQDYFSTLKGINQLTREDKALRLAQLREKSRSMGMIFTETTNEGGLLPPFQYLLVDEAHQLEQNFSGALSEYVSIKKFIRLLNEFRAAGGRFSKERLADITMTCQQITQLGRQIEEDFVSLRDATPHAIALRAAIHRLAQASSTIASIKIADPSPLLASLLRQLKKMTQTIISAVKTGTVNAYVEFSPVREYPQLFVGRSSVEMILKLMWEAVSAGAAVSATLYLKKGEVYSASYQSSLLSIPPARLKEYPPVFPAFLRETIAGVYFPEKLVMNDRLWLRPPTRSDKIDMAQREASERNWIKEVAAAILQIDADSNGGMLVLMSSYSATHLLGAALSEQVDRLVISQQGMSLAVQRDKFLMLSHAAMKPIWVATGAAWTGLDVGGHGPWRRLFGQDIDAKDDVVLTDLVIPRLPYGTNRSITHQYRLATRPTTPWELLETAFRLKQGIGRLVRREGLVKNRRIFLLDGRLNDPIFENAFSLVRRIVADYPLKLLQFKEGGFKSEVQHQSLKSAYSHQSSHPFA